VGAIAAIEDQAHLGMITKKVIATRNHFVEKLSKLGFETLPSSANFVFTKHPKHDGTRIHQALRDRGIIVRHFKTKRIDQFLRITIGTDEQMDALLGALNEILSL
jgi:histidinol-phosphate aminotransferase